jgi:hypothetical protein
MGANAHTAVLVRRGSFCHVLATRQTKGQTAEKVSLGERLRIFESSLCERQIKQGRRKFRMKALAELAEEREPGQ